MWSTYMFKFKGRKETRITSGFYMVMWCMHFTDPEGLLNFYLKHLLHVSRKKYIYIVELVYILRNKPLFHLSLLSSTHAKIKDSQHIKRFNRISLR